MSQYTVRVSAHRLGDSEPTNRHYLVPAPTPEQAVEIVKAMKPYALPFAPGVVFGHMHGSTFAVTGML